MVHLFFLISNYCGTYKRFGFYILNRFLNCVCKKNIPDKINHRGSTRRPLIIRGITALKHVVNYQNNNKDESTFS